MPSRSSRGLLALLALFLCSLPVASAQLMPVTFTLTRILETDCDEGLGEPCPNDFYAKVNIANQGLETGVRAPDDTADVSPNWTFTRMVDISAGAVPIDVQIWDHDDESGDDLIDISTGDRTLHLLFALSTASWSSEVPLNVGSSSGSGDDSAQVFFDITVGGDGDVDDDGLPDRVERMGVTNSSGILVENMATLGADPCRKTVAVEVDYMAAAGHTHQPQAAALAEAVAAFNAAPVPAVTPCPFVGFPNRPSGVNLVVDVDTPLPEQAALAWNTDATIDPTDAETVRNANLSADKRPYFHYSLWVHDQVAGSAVSGRCCSDSNKDFIVSLGSWTAQVGSVREQSGTFIHELGHALGLEHGGGDLTNCKPNYLSVMSYTFQTTGIPDPTLPAFNVDTNNDGLLDARFRLDLSRSALAPLNEGSLAESTGIQDGTDRTVWSADSGANLRAGQGGGAIDWNVTNTANPIPPGAADIDAAPVAVDVNDLGIRECGQDGATPPNPTPTPGETLTGFDDWTNLKYRAAASPDAGFVPEPTGPELDVSTARRLQEELLEALSPCKGVVFSTEEEFVAQAGAPPDGNPVVSDGDLISFDPSGGTAQLCARHRDLLGRFELLADLGVDAVDVVSPTEFLIAFSTELDDPRGRFTAGDLLFTTGLVVPHRALFTRFDPPLEGELGLDALQFIGRADTIRKLVEELSGQGERLRENGEVLIELLEALEADIWFSTEGSGSFRGDPLFLDGDLLSVRRGAVVVPQADLLPVTVPAGIPDRGVDFGLDAVATDLEGNPEVAAFSTEILFGGEPTFTEGDVLRFGNGVEIACSDLLQTFRPLAGCLGLDALDLISGRE